MRTDEPLSIDEDRPILPWRMVAGIVLHLVVPFYLLATLGDLVLAAPRVSDVETLLHEVMRITPALLVGYAGVAMLATVAAALVDPALRRRRVRRRERDPRAAARQSERRLRAAVTGAGTVFGPRAGAALERLAAARWDHEDARQQALSRDLAETAAASTAALATAPPERRDAIADMAARSFERIVAAQAEFAEARAQADERQARAITGYVETRYGPSDFPGEPD